MWVLYDNVVYELQLSLSMIYIEDVINGQAVLNSHWNPNVEGIDFHDFDVKSHTILSVSQIEVSHH
jgi:hypothetical protein